MTDIPIRCICGSFEARLERAGARYGNRVVCYCESCQEFARYLGRENEVLNEHGGSDIYQVSPGRLRILEGSDKLACVHLTEKPTLRWYTSCCNTPLGNTLASNRLPFIGLLTNSIDATDTPGGLDELIGPVRAHVNGSGARGDTTDLGISDSAPLSLYLGFIRLVLGAKLSGDYRKSPLFDPETGKPVVKPTRRDPPFRPGSAR